MKIYVSRPVNYRNNRIFTRFFTHHDLYVELAVELGNMKLL
jgi:hypothetical protein